MNARGLSFAESIGAACHDGFELTFVGGGRCEAVSSAVMWAGAVEFADRSAERLGGQMAVVLDNSRPSVELLLGLIAAGIGVVSLPLPHRGQPLDEYVEFCERVRNETHSSVVAIPDEFYGIARNAGLKCAVPTSSVIDGSVRVPAEAPHREDDFDLVQFTSGTTANAKGIVFHWSRVHANVQAIHAWLQPTDGDVGLFWLPMSHDMGLVGGFFTSILAGTRMSKGSLVLLRPQDFARDPAVWFSACSHFGATITAGPDFAYQLAARAVHPDSLSLATIRACIAGSEPVRLRTFAWLDRALSPAGWRATSYSPAYGLAEAGLAVTGCPVDEAPLAALEDGRLEPALELVASDVTDGLLCSGRPLNGFRVDAGSSAGEAEVAIAGPSVADRYLDRAVPRDEDGYLHTGDTGWLAAEGLVVTGRVDDTIVVGGRNVSAPLVEQALGQALGLRPGKAAVAVNRRGALVVLIEHPGSTVKLADVRNAVRQAAGVSPSACVTVPKGGMPRTPSGKLRRSELVNLIESEERHDL